MEKIRIAHIAGGLTTGGVEAVIYNYFSHMDRDRYELLYISYDAPDPQVQKRFEKLGFKVYTVTKKKENFVKSCVEVYRILKQNRVQIVHSHMTLICFVTNLLGRAAGAKRMISHSHLVVYPAGIKKPLYAVFKLLSRLTATDWFACSKDATLYLFGRRAWENGKVQILNNAIDSSAYWYHPEAAEQTRVSNGMQGCIVIGNVGRFTEQKNQLFALEVFDVFHRRIPQSRLLLVGSGPMLEQVRQRAAEMGLEKAVIFPGSDPEPAKFYHAMDLFLFPSVYEGLGIVALEAQAAALPVLASNVVPREVVVSDHVHFLSLEQPAHVWAETLEQLLPERGQMIAQQQMLHRSLREHHFEIEQEAVWLDCYYHSQLGWG